MLQTLWSFLDLNGTASRKRGSIIFGIWLVGSIGLFAAAMAFLEFRHWVLIPLMMLQAIFIVTLVQRLHDAGRSGLWVFLGAIPMLGLLSSLGILLLRPAPEKHQGSALLQKLGYCGLLLLAAFAAARLFWTPFWIPSGNMKPTLLVGDYIVVTGQSAASFQRGDVVVFRHPTKANDLVGRLLGLPGDDVQMKDGLLYINGDVAKQVEDGEFIEVFEKQGPMQALPMCGNSAVGLGDSCINDRALETLPNGAVYPVLNVFDDSPGDSSDPITVPEGMFFFMGDNRDNSLDSRFAQSAGGPGLVPAENLIGKAQLVIFSSSSSVIFDPPNWRANRFFWAIK